MTCTLAASLLLAASFVCPTGDELPDPDGKPADTGKPVKVFVLLGQSNMLGFGKVAGEKAGTLEHAVKVEGLYPFLVDDQGAWTTRKDVRNVRVMVARGGGMRVHANDWLSIKGKKIGPEVGIGHRIGHALEEPVLILKSCIGNRSLGWDLLPPGSPGYEFEDGGKTWVYAGSGESPHRWEKGTEPKKIGWYAGKQYDDDVANAKKVLEELSTYYPNATRFEVAGFFWWQGDKDRYDRGHAAMYERNLLRLIDALRADFDAPEAKFVCASLGQTEEGSDGVEGQILDAMMAVDGKSEAHPALKDDVRAVYTHPLSQGGASNGHYGGDARTYMNVGLAMGEAMVELLRLEEAKPRAKRR